jgi:hypothetical protein
MRKIRRGIALAVVVAGGYGAYGCATDASTIDAGDAGGGGGIYRKLGVTPPGAKNEDGEKTPTGFDFGTVKSPYEDADGCKAFTSKDMPKGFHAPERDCLCDNCFDLQRQCDALVGCQEIMHCVLEIGCTDANSCYLGPPKKPGVDPEGKGCIEVIDRWGNGGVATALSNIIGDCTKANNCLMPAGQ